VKWEEEEWGKKIDLLHSRREKPPSFYIKERNHSPVESPYRSPHQASL
jgi:hypothetical protein